jgi:hypothetical protein
MMTNIRKIEDDADTSLRLFAAQHHFHLLLANNANDDGDDDDDDDDDDDYRRVQRGNGAAGLTNGMCFHLMDALTKSPSIERVIEVDALLWQFVSLHVGRRHGGGVVAPRWKSKCDLRHVRIRRERLD